MSFGLVMGDKNNNSLEKAPTSPKTVLFAPQVQHLPGSKGGNRPLSGTNGTIPVSVIDSPAKTTCVIPDPKRESKPRDTASKEAESAGTNGLKHKETSPARTAISNRDKERPILSVKAGKGLGVSDSSHPPPASKGVTKPHNTLTPVKEIDKVESEGVGSKGSTKLSSPPSVPKPASAKSPIAQVPKQPPVPTSPVKDVTAVGESGSSSQKVPESKQETKSLPVSSPSDKITANNNPKRPTDLGLVSIMAKTKARKKDDAEATEIDTNQNVPLLNKSRATPKAIFIKEPDTAGAQNEDQSAPMLTSGACEMELTDADDPDGRLPKERSGPTVAFLVDEETDEQSDGSGSVVLPPHAGCCAWRGFDIAAIVGLVIVLCFAGVALSLHLDGELESFLGIEAEKAPPGGTGCRSDDGKSSVCSLNAVCVEDASEGDAQYPCKCLPGYTGSGYRCDDINECLLSSPNCTKNSHCHNTVGSYTCRCRQGYTGDGACVDVNECQGHFYCPVHSECVNTYGSYKCACTLGYHGDGGYCRDVNECQTDEHRCHANATCINKSGSYSCVCKMGFFGNGTHCEVDECFVSNKYFCDKNAGCRMLGESIECICKSGYTGNGVKCRDINECALPGFCDKHASCQNTNGSYVCTCNDGFYGDGRKCTDFDECHHHRHTCSQNAVCKNTLGSYTCPCLSGYYGYECTDVDECETKAHRCSTDAMCINTSGSYECVCNKGYHGNGTHCDCAGSGCATQARCKGKACNDAAQATDQTRGVMFAASFVHLMVLVVLHF